MINRALSLMVARFSLLIFNFYLYISTYGFAINISPSRMFSLQCFLLLKVVCVWGGGTLRISETEKRADDKKKEQSLIKNCCLAYYDVHNCCTRLGHWLIEKEHISIITIIMSE